jgi:hypothetical protein
MAKILDTRDVQAFAADLVATLEQLSGAAETLDKVRQLINGVRPHKTAARAATKAAPKTTRRRRGRGPKLDPAKLLADVAAIKSGASLGDLIKKHNVSGQRIRQALVKLRSEGRIKMTGTRRTALWHATGTAKRKASPKNGASNATSA